MLSRSLLALSLAASLAPAAHAAGPDHNVEWAGISHHAWQDRRPLCPLAGETFQVRFQAWRNDLTAARVQVNAGGAAWVDAAVVATRGPYDIWAAQVPSTALSSESYWIELTDGSDTDYLSVNGLTDGVPADGGYALDFATLDHAPVGATRAGSGTVFKVWAPNATVAHVLGQFNSWTLPGIPMAKVGEHFIVNVPTAVHRQLYKYRFENAHWRTDARGRAIDPVGNNFNSFIEDPFAFTWSDAAWQTPPLDQMVIYQLHTGTFAGRNDPAGSAPYPSRYVDVTNRVSHLVDLGVNAVLLNPINEFPGDESAGYNPQSNWAPEWKYGTPDEFKQMVNVLHQNGIAVLLDIVWNHFTVNDNVMWQYDGTQVYFDTPAVDTPWGAQADFDRVAVRDYYAHSAHHWLEEYHLDGFRMDATDYMNRAPQDASGWALMQRLNDEVDRRWADKVVIAEQLPNDAFVTRPTSLGGAGFDSQYHDAFVDNLRQEVFDSALGDPEMFRIQGIVNGSGTYLNGPWVTNYFELHDEAWPSSGGSRAVKTIDTTFPHDDIYARGRTKLAQGLVLLSPGVPAFLQGAEWLEDTDFGANFNARIDWSKKITYAPIVQYFRDLIDLRTGTPAFRSSAPWQVFHVNEGSNVIAFHRYDGGSGVYVVLANFSNANYNGYRIGLPQAGTWTEALNGQAAAYGGNGITNPGNIASEAVAADIYSQSAVINVPQMSIVVLSWGSTVGVPGAPVAEAATLSFSRVGPIPARSEVSVEFQLARPGAVRLTIHDVRGRRVTSLVDAELAAGPHTGRWNGTDAEGRPAPAGVYFLRLESQGETAVRRVPLMR